MANAARVIGVVADEPKLGHSMFGENFWEFHVDVDRKFVREGSKGTDTLLVTVSDRTIDPGLISKGDDICIRGSIRTYTISGAKDRNNQVKVAVFARDVALNDAEKFNKYDSNNEVYLQGIISRSPSFKDVGGGRQLCSSAIKAGRVYDKSDFILCIAWGRNANFLNGMKEGDQIEAWGRMQRREFESTKEDGSKEMKIVHELSINRLKYKENDEDVEKAVNDILLK